jgi:hypothetical protein
MQPFATIRVKALYSWAEVDAMERHGKRSIGNLDHIDRTRSALTRFGSQFGEGRDVRTCMKAVAEKHGARQRKDAPIGTHVLLLASPEYFRPGRAHELGTWEQDRLEPWLQANLDWLNKRFPDQLACWRLDLDESTPHVDAFLVPIHRRVTKTGKQVVEISHRQAFSAGRGRRSYEALQSEYARAMSKLGLRRGRPARETGARHKPPMLLRREMADDAAYMSALKTGMSLWSLGRMWNMRYAPDGQPEADFTPKLAVERHPQLIAACKPAWAGLVAFSKRVERESAKFVRETARDLISDLEEERKQARWLLNEGQAILEDLRIRGFELTDDAGERLCRMAKELAR